MIDLTVTNPAAVGLVPWDGTIRDALADPLAGRYDPDPRGAAAAREAIARAFTAPDSALDPERIALTSSTSEAYAHLFRLLAGPGDDIAVPRPSYPLLEPIARLETVEVLSYRLVYDERWRLDMDSLEAAIGPRTRAIVLVEPNNPTGSVLSTEERRHVEALAERRGVAIIADEVFGEFPWVEGAALPTWAGPRAVPTFVLGGLSKSCGLPQLKCAWISMHGPAAALEELGAGLEWVLDLFLSVGTPVQVALPKLLGERGRFRDTTLARVRGNLATWRAWAARSGAEILNADGGWAAVARLPGRWSEGGADAAEWILQHLDVLVHPAHFYDWDDDRHVVVSLLAPPEDVAEGLRRLENGISGGRMG